MATIVGGHRLVTHAVDRVRGRHANGRQSRLGAGIRGLRPGACVAREEKAGRAVLGIQRSRHVVFFRPLFEFHAGLLGYVCRGGRRRRAETAAGHQRDIRPWQSTSRLARRGRVRPRVLSGEGSRPRRFLAALDHAATRERLARGDRAVAGRRAAVSDPDRAALLRARALVAQGHLELSRRPQGRDRRLRRALASGQRRARRLQQHGLGHGVSASSSKRTPKSSPSCRSQTMRSAAVSKARKS